MLNSNNTKFILVGLFLILLSNSSQEQIVSQDKIKYLTGIEVKAKRIFKKEEAGMRETLVDSLVMIKKVNLSLSDLLSENTSVFIKSHGRGALATASFRGTASSHTQVKWNGMDINSQMTGMVDFSLIPVFIIDDIGLKHGTSSIADRSGGLGGSIVLNNKMPIDTGFHFKFIQGIGSYKTFDDYLQLSWGNKKIKLKNRVYHNYSKNDYKFINRSIVNIDPVTGELTNPLDTNDNADYRRFGMLQEVYYLPTSKDVVSLKYWTQKADRTIPRATSFEGAANANLNNQIDIDHKVVADYSHYFDKSKLTLRTGFNANSLLYTLHNYVSGAGIIPAVYSMSRQKSSINNARYVYNFDDSFSISYNIDFNYHHVSSKDSVKLTGYDVNRTEFSHLLTVSKRFFDRVNTNLMLRQDITDWKLCPFIPYFGFDVKLLKKEDLIFKGNVARNYHQPTLNDLYWQPGGNPDLLPEKGVSYELGLEYQKLFDKHLLNTELTFYQSDIDNWIIWIPTFKGYWAPMNIRNVKSTGVEYSMSLNGNINQFEYRIKGNYAYTKSINYGDTLVWGNESYGKQLVYVPLHSGNLIINLEYKGFFVTYQFNSYSERFTTSSNDVSIRDWLYPYFMNDLFLGKKIKGKKLEYTIEFKIYNLFNETYHSILYRPMPKQNYLLQFEVKL